jgi:hypothetical protein
MAPKKSSWSWSNVMTKGKAKKPVEPTEVSDTPQLAQVELEQASKRARKDKAEAPAVIEPIEAPAAKGKPLATLAKIAESKGWTMDEALAEAVNALSQRLYGKPAL